MTSVYDVPADPLIKVLAGKVKDLDPVKEPEWAPFVTTGVHREKPPVEADWWYSRVAAVLRKVYTIGPIGTERLRAEFGGPRNRGVRPQQARKGSGSVVREALQQLEAAGLVESVKGEGRRITGKGQSLVDNAAHEAKQTLLETVPALQKY